MTKYRIIKTYEGSYEGKYYVEVGEPKGILWWKYYDWKPLVKSTVFSNLIYRSSMCHGNYFEGFGDALYFLSLYQAQLYTEKNPNVVLEGKLRINI